MRESLARRTFLGQTALAAAGFAAGQYAVTAAPAENSGAAVELRDDQTVLDVRVGGQPFAVYNYNSTHAGLYRPFFHPIMGPTGRPITQNGEFPGSLRGHYWHRALFVAHQKVNGVSFWEEREADCGRIVHLGFDEVSSGETGRFVERLAWRDLHGHDLLHETRIVQAPKAEPRARTLDLILKLRAVRGDVTFARTPYNLLACRVRDSMCRVAEKEKYTRNFGALADFAPLREGGRIMDSEGRIDDACRGARAKWCDFSGPLGDGTWGGIALLDHPCNPRHPTPWHNWNNMTITASFTYHEPFTLKRDEELWLQYRVLVHAGDAPEAGVAEAWNEFARLVLPQSGRL